MTPFDLYIESQANELKFRREKVLDLQLLNSVMNIFGESSVDFDYILGYKTLKDYNLRTPQDFLINGKFNISAWETYLRYVVIPIKKGLGMEV